MRNKPYDGLFITIEGGEGAGKTTLAERLASYFETHLLQVVKTREPGGSTLSEVIRNMLLNKDPTIAIGDKAELFLFLSARAQHVEEVILPALREGKVVISERFNDSTVAYQGCARHLGMQEVEKLCVFASSELQPDRTFFLDLDPEEGLRRVRENRGEPFDRLESEKLQFHREVRQGFLHLADKYGERIKILDATFSKDEVFNLAKQELTPLLKARR